VTLLERNMALGGNSTKVRVGWQKWGVRTPLPPPPAVLLARRICTFPRPLPRISFAIARARGPFPVWRYSKFPTEVNNK
jgi:hypothetical protein